MMIPLEAPATDGIPLPLELLVAAPSPNSTSVGMVVQQPSTPRSPAIVDTVGEGVEMMAADSEEVHSGSVEVMSEKGREITTSLIEAGDTETMLLG